MNTKEYYGEKIIQLFYFVSGIGLGYLLNEKIFFGILFLITGIFILLLKSRVDKKEVKKMSEKSKNNAWQDHLKKVREENKGKKASEIFKIAQDSYKK